ncbi:MAG: DUF2029 domain-containing protein [Ignavibacteriaceae bacterium]|nr:DUF2029 domain-containing protein [Ignavibacteriaceae bacterium]MCW8823017.1 DUF2029 domain-containing protein [Ignavibacteriaceae bacterium]MCW8995977.1 DUF2029 domain-containing protein [Psychromonas sp.]MCW9094680.1 DUF2029 domain-containing protein [Ignavibacteriaceae bacterium]
MSSISTGILNEIIQYKVKIFWLIVFILACYFIYYVIQHAACPSHGFASYYTASRLLIKGDDVNNFYNDNWFSSRVEEYVPEVYEIYNVNMPTTAFLFLPLAFLDYSNARIIWTIFNLIIILITLIYLIKKLQFENFLAPLLIILFLCFQPLYSNFAYGQVYILIFCLLVLAWFAYKSRRDELLGFLLALVFILKTAGIFLILLLLLQKKWRSLLWALTTAILLITACLPRGGIDAWYSYLGRLVHYSSHPSLSVTAYQSIHSFFHHFTAYDKQWNQEPLFNLPILGNILSVIFSLMLIIITSIKTNKLKKTDLSFGAFVIAGIVISPVSLDYHYVLILIPIVILLNWLRQNPSKLFWILFIIFYLLIAVFLPYISPKVTGGLWVVFAYPKLYGAIGLLGLLLFAAYKSKLTEIKTVKK